MRRSVCLTGLLRLGSAAFIAALSLAGGQAVGGEAPVYSLRFLGEGFPTAVNNGGEVVGGWMGSPDRAWYADPSGNVVELPVPPGATQTKANDINGNGLIVGTATFDGGTPRACSWSLVNDAWEVTLLESLPVSFGSYGTAVNDLGDIVGTNIGALGSRAVLFTGPDGPTSLYELGLTDTPVDVNNERQVVGEQLVLDLDDLSVIDTGVPAGSYLWSDAVAMNDAGQVAARVVTASGSFYPVAAKFDPETGWQVLSAPATGNTAADINNHGDTLIFIQSSWGQQPYLLIDGTGAFRVQELLEPGLELWFIENVGALAMNDHNQLAVVVSHFVTGEYGAALLTPRGGDPADLDGDGVVGFSDLLILLGAWGDCAGCPADFDGDGVISFSDLLMLLAAWT